METESTAHRSLPTRLRRAAGRNHDDPSVRRAIGAGGTAARTIVGLWLLTDVFLGHWTLGFRIGSWLLGLVVFPGVLLAWQWARSRRGTPPLRATGPVGHVLNLLAFLALYLTFWYAPALEVTSDAALIFYGVSMVLAAMRGYAGCEVLAVSNWLLRRDDQVGCTLFLPVDHAERGGASGDGVLSWPPDART